MVALSFLSKQWQQIKLDCGIPVEKFRVGMILFELLTFHRIRAHYLSHEVIITCGILRVHHRCGGIGLDGILKYTPVGIVTIYDSRSNIGCEGEEPALARMHHGSTRTIFLTS